MNVRIKLASFFASIMLQLYEIARCSNKQKAIPKVVLAQ
jgi:hypothetical protein